MKEQTIRLSFFLGTLAVMFLWQSISPRRKLSAPRLRRWSANLGIVVISSVLISLLRLAPVSIAIFAATEDIGIFHMLNVPFGISIVLGIMLLDLIIYAQHVFFHKVPFFWRFHKMHHTDLDIDVTTGLRFHPIEILLSVIIKIAAVLIFGINPIAVFIFEVMLNAAAMFNHANAKIQKTIDKYLRLLIVTPDMHRVHHSVHREETDSNFGFNVPWWDRLFGTYIAQPKDRHQKMKIGLDTFRDNRYLRLRWLLAIPFVKDRSD